MDYQSTETWDNAVQWVDRLFLMPPPFDPHAFDTLSPFLDWAVSAGTGKVVLLSAMAIDREPDLALIRLERHLRELDIAATSLRPNLYMQNLSAGFIADSINDLDEIEVSAGNGRVSFVDAADVAAVAAAALTGDSLDGATITLTGDEAFGFADVASRIADAAGRTVDYRPADHTRMREILRAANISNAAAAIALELFDSIQRGEREPVDTALADITGRPPTRLDDFIARSAAAWR
jgi:uncharacterized protein YbjT (DUF2867 family)